MWTNNQRLVQLTRRHQSSIGYGFEPMMGDHGAFLGEAFDVLGFLLEKSLGDEERKLVVAMTGGLEHAIEDPLHLLPERVAPGLDDHAPSNRRVLSQISGSNHLLVPLGVVFSAGGSDCGLGLGHGRQYKEPRLSRR